MAIEYPDVGASFNLVKCFMACRSVVKQTNNASRCQAESRPMLGHIDVARHSERLHVLNLSFYVSCFSLHERLISRESGVTLKALACEIYRG